ncbi:MAG: DUF1501 domain-containing protein [Planctomycetaceae bacterium]|nr:DUF1501 domain-containing protein [Planctomycetaceae bacterium]
MEPHVITRRDLLATTAQSIGIAGLATVLGGQASAATGPLAAKPPHFAPRAKRIIHLWMNGGPSQVDTFDPKPALEKFAGQRPGTVNLSTERKTTGLMPSPFRFTKHGRSGMDISELFPHLARHADDLCVIRSMHTNTPVHEASNWLMFTGYPQPIRPSYGSWLLYGLGSLNENLPGFVVLGEGQPVNGPSNWSSRFLPGIYQGCQVVLPTGYDPRKVLADLSDPYAAVDAQRRRLDFAQHLNSIHLRRQGEDNAFVANIESLELAYRMQTSASEAFDVSSETAATHDAYGISGPDLEAGKAYRRTFGRNCLLARRLLERGVRVVQIYTGNSQPWDTHGNNSKKHKDLASLVDQPIAALLQDLKQRGLLDDTLVVWGGEFGRTPTTEGADGRDHNHYGFTMWLAGGGVRGGMVLGATDEFGFKAVENRVHVHDLHATMLHLMGLDHEKLTYHYSGRDYRLTDVHGRVVKEIFA